MVQWIQRGQHCNIGHSPGEMSYFFFLTSMRSQLVCSTFVVLNYPQLFACDSCITLLIKLLSNQCNTC
uniref:Uncharacterized protein n=1 Tax=Arundo donax TaxID=35708 RepID=A0A0A9GH67_ARUDO